MIENTYCNSEKLGWSKVSFNQHNSSELQLMWLGLWGQQIWGLLQQVLYWLNAICTKQSTWD